MNQNCKYKCIWIDAHGDCQQGGGECVQEDCPYWQDCDSCQKYGDCEV